MFYSNGYVLNLAQSDPAFRRILNSADALIAEGFGSCFSAKLLGYPVPEQLATMDWMDEFLSRLAEAGHSIFLVGDEPGVSAACAAEMRRRHPGLKVAGTHHGFFLDDRGEEEALLRSIHQLQPDVLMVGMGNPRQEYWIDSAGKALNVPLVMALGAMFRWYSGTEARAPRLLRELHLEWFARLLSHPVRHFRRYVVGNPMLVFRCLRQRWG